MKRYAALLGALLAIGCEPAPTAPLSPVVASAAPDRAATPPPVAEKNSATLCTLESTKPMVCHGAELPVRDMDRCHMVAALTCKARILYGSATIKCQHMTDLSAVTLTLCQPTEAVIVGAGPGEKRIPYASLPEVNSDGHIQ
jgi:hypothetical protein